MSDKMKTVFAVLITLLFVFLPFGIMLGAISFKVIGAIAIILFDILAIAGGVYIIYMVASTFREGFLDKDGHTIALGVFFGFLLSCYVFLVAILVVSTPNTITELMLL